MGLWFAASFPALTLVLSFIRLSFVLDVGYFRGMTSLRGIGTCPLRVNERSCCDSGSDDQP